MGLKYKYQSGTSIGKVRKGNEDAFGQLLNDQSNGNGSVFVVCDGMGGHVGGAVASQTAVNSIISFFKSTYYPDPFSAIKNSILFANQKIFQLSKEKPELKGMGTTCVVLLQRDNEIYIGHVGDSRIYIHTDKQIYRVTKDHSYVQGLVDSGVIVEEDGLTIDEQMEAHPRSNELSKALGIRDVVVPEICPTPIHAKKGDSFILCTDGLTGLVNDLNISATMNNNYSLSKVVNSLIKMANNAGGKDNITVTALTITDSLHHNTQFINKGNQRVVLSGTYEHNIEEDSSSFSNFSNQFSFFVKNNKLILGFTFSFVLCLALVLFLIFKKKGVDKIAGDSIPGCIDETALNYDSKANTDDGSCEYEDEDPEDINNGLGEESDAEKTKKTQRKQWSSLKNDKNFNNMFNVYEKNKFFKKRKWIKDIENTVPEKNAPKACEVENWSTDSDCSYLQFRSLNIICIKKEYEKAIVFFLKEEKKEGKKEEKKEEKKKEKKKEEKIKKSTYFSPEELEEIKRKKQDKLIVCKKGDPCWTCINNTFRDDRSQLEVEGHNMSKGEKSVKYTFYKATSPDMRKKMAECIKENK